MYRNIHLRSAAALIAMFCLMFSQLAVAAYACPAPAHSAAVEMVLQASDHRDGGDDLCAEHDPGRPGLCLAHCNPAQLSLNHAQADAPPVMLVALHLVPDHCEPTALTSTAPQPDVPLRSHSPPHAVLHCCFRI